MSDLIDRQSAIDALHKLMSKHKHDRAGCIMLHWSWIDDMLKNLPPADKPAEPNVRTVAIYDEEQTFANCSVQVWRNSVTGESSWGWWPND